MDYKLLGKNIAQARINNHLTQEQLAERVNISTVFVSQIETAIRKPSLETLYKFSTELNTTIDSLIGNDDIATKYDEILKLLNGKTRAELNFIIKVIKEISNNISDGRIIDCDDT